MRRSLRDFRIIYLSDAVKVTWLQRNCPQNSLIPEERFPDTTSPKGQFNVEIETASAPIRGAYKPPVSHSRSPTTKLELPSSASHTGSRCNGGGFGDLPCGAGCSELSRCPDGQHNHVSEDRGYNQNFLFSSAARHSRSRNRHPAASRRASSPNSGLTRQPGIEYRLVVWNCNCFARRLSHCLHRIEFNNKW